MLLTVLVTYSHFKIYIIVSQIGKYKGQILKKNKKKNRGKQLLYMFKLNCHFVKHFNLFLNNNTRYKSMANFALLICYSLFTGWVCLGSKNLKLLQ